MAEPTAFVLTHESNSENKKFSASLQALAITRSLGRRGVRVVRVHPHLREVSLKSRYCWKAEVGPNVHDSEAALVKYLLELGTRYDAPRVLLPASDDTAFFLGKHKETLCGTFELPVPAASTIETIINKRLQYEAAQKLGIPIPETYFPQSLKDAERIAHQIQGYPYVIKPNVAHRWRMSSVEGRLSSKKGGATKGVVARTPEQLVDEFKKISQVDSDVMVQEVIGGSDERLYTFLGYFDNQARPLGYCVRSKLRQAPLNFGYCTLTTSCENDTVVAQSIRLLEGLNFHGIVGVEWKHDPKTGIYKLIEINARAVNTSAIAPACGVDLPYIAFADAIGRPLSPVTRWETGVKWIWFTQDIWAVRDLFRLGQLTLPQWWRSISGKRVHAVFAPDDLIPFSIYFAEFCASLVRAALSHLRRVFVRG